MINTKINEFSKWVTDKFPPVPVALGNNILNFSLIINVCEGLTIF